MSAATDDLARRLDSFIKDFRNGEIEFVFSEDSLGIKRFGVESNEPNSPRGY